MSYQYQYIDGAPIHFLPGKLICVGYNYTEHAKELNSPVPTEPLLLIKPGFCMVPVSGELNLPQERGSIHHEAEIVVLIGKPLSCKPNHGEVPNTISGYALALDLILREVQAKLKEKDLPRESIRSFDGTGVLSPFVNADRFPGPTDIGVRLTINGEARQDGNSYDMFNPIAPLIQRVAGHFLLQTGDVVLAGIPFEIGPLNSGDELLLELSDVDRLEARIL